MNRRQTLSARLLRIFCATLMLSLGFAHRPVAAIAAPSAAFDEAYRLPDGTFAEICETHANPQIVHGQGKSDHSGTSTLFCEACLLASSILVPTPDVNSWLRADFVWLDNRPTLDVALSHADNGQQPKARAPPIPV